MGMNQIVVNGGDRWEIPDSKMPAVIAMLDVLSETKLVLHDPVEGKPQLKAGQCARCSEENVVDNRGRCRKCDNEPKKVTFKGVDMPHGPIGHVATAGE